jgi:hypothetical protein
LVADEIVISAEHGVFLSDEFALELVLTASDDLGPYGPW